MPHDAECLSEAVVEKSSHGGHDMVIRRLHDAPAGPDGEVLDDPFASMDLANAEWMMGVLNKHYAGVPWRTVYDGRNKMAHFSIPILMGINRYWSINLTADELSEGLLMRAGGELLERYKVPRDRFDLAAFLSARALHSALLVQSRDVPK
jgi:hypothetical protein